MVTLSKIYTRTGDAGTTRLSDNSETAKTDPRLEAYGSTDEAGAVIGVALAGEVPDELRPVLTLIQNELFDVGADLSTPVVAEPKWAPLRIEQHSIDRLERWCDEFGDQLPTLRSFILSGGTPAAAQLHVARTVVRRAERAAWACVGEFGTSGEGSINSLAVTYLNRLSDLLFILARYCNLADGHPHDVLWVPGTDRENPNIKGRDESSSDL